MGGGATGAAPPPESLEHRSDAAGCACQEALAKSLPNQVQHCRSSS